jgi:hypothetical protein
VTVNIEIVHAKPAVRRPVVGLGARLLLAVFIVIIARIMLQ